MAKKQLKPGRKKLSSEEKKIGVTLYIKNKTVIKYGGRTGTVNEIMGRIDPFE
jgi:rRNA processing protein Gar1